MDHFIDLPNYTSDRKITGNTPYEQDLLKLKIFKNDAFIECEEKNEAFKKEISATLSLKGFRRVYQVNFQINNTCNYASIHTVCPVHFFKNRESLPTPVVHKVIDELAGVGYSGIIAFSVYNEPMGDERFFDFCRYAKMHCPRGRIFVTTNGSYLNQTSLREAEEAGIVSIFVSAYTEKEYRRLITLKTDIGLCIYPMVLDRRMEIYEREYLNCTRPCFAPFADVSIDVRGNVILCCLDHRSSYVYGNVTSDTLEQIIGSDELESVYRDLSRGNRVLEICRRCDYARR